MVETFPSIIANSADFGLRTLTRAFTNPLGGTVQTYELPGARFHASLVFSNLSEDNAATMRAFLAKLGGTAGRFYYGDPDYMAHGPRGVATGTPLVKGASQTGKSLITDGWTISTTNILRAGDYIHFTNASGFREFKMITADVNSDSGGNATISFNPPIRTAPADNAAITVTNAMCQMMLVDDAQTKWRIRPGQLSDFSINAIEVFTD